MFSVLQIPTYTLFQQSKDCIIDLHCVFTEAERCKVQGYGYTTVKGAYERYEIRYELIKYGQAQE